MWILKYMILTLVINLLIIGEDFWEMLVGLPKWIMGKVESDRLFGFYDDISWVQVLAIWVLELVAIVYCVSSSASLTQSGGDAEDAGEQV